MRAVAALVNLRAHRVTPALVGLLRRDLGDEQVHATSDLDQARAAIAAIVAAGVEVLCVVGGDGTFIFVCEVLFHLRPARPPTLFALRFGLGNAISDISGACAPTVRGLATDLARARGDEAPSPLPLLLANGRVACYAGVGRDADFVDDLYRVAKGRWRAWSSRWGGVPGLVATVATRTLPRWLTRPPMSLRIVNLGAPARRMSPAGQPTGAPAPTGATLYEGPALVAAAGTIPSYGRRFWFFPHADRVPQGSFHLRVWSISPGRAIAYLPSIWRGTYFPEGGVHDWAAESVAIRWSVASPIHIGGDLCPPARELTLSTLSWRVPILRSRA